MAEPAGFRRTNHLHSQDEGPVESRLCDARRRDGRRIVPPHSMVGSISS